MPIKDLDTAFGGQPFVIIGPSDGTANLDMVFGGQLLYVAPPAVSSARSFRESAATSDAISTVVTRAALVDESAAASDNPVSGLVVSGVAGARDAMDYAFGGQPFVQIKIGISSTMSLDYALGGQPFAVVEPIGYIQPMIAIFSYPQMWR